MCQRDCVHANNTSQPRAVCKRHLRSHCIVFPLHEYDGVTVIHDMELRAVSTAHCWENSNRNATLLLFHDESGTCTEYGLVYFVGPLEATNARASSCRR
jgi:hypothetical protein